MSINPFDNFNSYAKEVIKQSQELACQHNQRSVGSLHLFAALLANEDNILDLIFNKLNINLDHLYSRTIDAITKLPTDSVRHEGIIAAIPTREFATAIEGALAEAKKMEEHVVAVEHIFIAIVRNPGSTESILGEFGITLSKVQSIFKELQPLEGSQKTRNNKDTIIQRPKHRHLQKYTRDLTELAAQNKLDPMIGREETLSRVIQIILRRSKNNPILIGEAGVGKTALTEGLAQRIVEGDVPESLRDRKLLLLDMGLLLAGTKYRGEFEERLKSIMKEIESSEIKPILFIDEIHTIVGMGSGDGSAVDASNLLKPALARGELFLIGATTPQEYQKHIERDHALTRRFQPVYVTEPSLDDAIAILRGLRDRYELFHGIRIDDNAIVKAVHLSSRYLTDRYLPDKAIDLLDEASSTLRIVLENKPTDLDKAERDITRLEIEKKALTRDYELKKERKTLGRIKTIDREIADLKASIKDLSIRWNKEKEIIAELKAKQKEYENQKHESERAINEGDLDKASEIRYGIIPQLRKEIELASKRLQRVQKARKVLKEVVGEEDIANVVSRWTGIPVTRMLENEIEKLSRIESGLKRSVIGQDEAVEKISATVKRSRTGIADPNRPIGSFLFLGPTGVGKTELAKQLAKFLFDNEKALLRIDMSEYMEAHAVSKLIGAPPGYVGHEEAGGLTEAVRHRPFSIILFDEIEKAHPDVSNILLQILEDGHLTDGRNKKVNFKNTIIILTSNIGSSQITEDNGAIGFSKDDKEKEEEQNYKKIKETVMTELKTIFREELINRFDEIITFRPLTPETIRTIVSRQLEIVKNRLKEKNIIFKVSAGVENKLAVLGYDRKYGARPLRRAIQTQILNPLANQLIALGATDNLTVIVSLDDDTIVVSVSHNKKRRKKIAVKKNKVASR